MTKIATSIDWVIGIGISFGIAFILTSLSFKNVKAFLLYFTMFVGFFVYAGHLDLWMLIACIILDVVVIYTSMRSKKGGGVEI